MNKTEKNFKDEIVQLKQKHVMELQAYEIRIRNSDKVLETKLKTIQDISDKIQEFSKFLFQQDLNLSKKNMLDNIKQISVILLQEKDSYDIMATQLKIKGQTGPNDIKNRQEIQTLQLEIDEQQHFIEQSKEKIKHQENQIVDQEKIIHKIQVVLKEHEIFLQQKDEKLNELDSTLKKKDNELANMMNQHQRKENELDNMMKQSVRIVKQNEEEINKIINKKKEEINEINLQKEKVLLQKQQEINEINLLKEKVLLQKEQEIFEIQKQKEQIAIQKENEIKNIKTQKMLQHFQKAVQIVEIRNRADKSINDMRDAFSDEVHQKEDEINYLKKKTEDEMIKIKHEFIDEVHHKEEQIKQINRLKEQQIHSKEEEIIKLKSLTRFREAAHIALLQQQNLKEKENEINCLKEDLLHQKDDEIKKLKLQNLQDQSDALNRLRESLQLQNQKQCIELTKQIQFQQIFFDELIEKQRKDQELLSQNYTIMLSKMQKQSQKMMVQQKNIEKLYEKHQQDELIIKQQELALMDPNSAFKLFRTWSSFIKLPTKEHYFEDQLLSQRRNNQSLTNRSADRFKNDSHLNTARNLTPRCGEGGNTARNLTPSRYDTVKKDRKQDPQFNKQIQIEQVMMKFRKWAFNISYQIKQQINEFKKKEVVVFYLILKKQGAKITPQCLINMLEQIYKHTHFIDNTIQQITHEKSPNKTEKYNIQEKQYFEEIDNINLNNQKKDEKKFDYKDAQKIKNRICSSQVLKEFKQISKK